MGMQEREKVAAEEAAREEDIALGNPLLNKADFNVKRRYAVATRPATEINPLTGHRWDDDVVFKNQARGTEDKGKKEFVNVRLNGSMTVTTILISLSPGPLTFGFP